MTGIIETARGEPVFRETSIRGVHHRCCAAWHEHPQTKLNAYVQAEAAKFWRLRMRADTAAGRIDPVGTRV